MRHVLRNLFLLTGLLLVCSWTSFGADVPCKEDVSLACPKEKLPPAKLKKCIKDHAAKPGKACPVKEDTATKLMGAMQACKADADKFCGEAKDMKETKTCLKSHLKELSTLCKAQVSNSGLSVPGF